MEKIAAFVSNKPVLSVVVSLVIGFLIAFLFSSNKSIAPPSKISSSTSSSSFSSPGVFCESWLIGNAPYCLRFSPTGITVTAGGCSGTCS